MARKIYTTEFKEQAAKLSYASGKWVAQTVADLGLPTNMLHRTPSEGCPWWREAKQTGRVFPGHGKARGEEMAELKKRLKQAELERDILKKAVGFCGDTEVKYRFIESCAHGASHLPVDGLCSYLEVARSGYYEWLKRELSSRAQEDRQLGEVIEAEFYKHYQAYGSPRMCDRLRQLGRHHGRRRVGRLMAERGLIAQKKRRFVATTVADPSRQPAPNMLNREFAVDGPNRKWVSDIIVIPTYEGDLYLATTKVARSRAMDLWSRMIVGWAIRETMEEELVQLAFDMAVQRRWPDPGLLHHSDQGSQYTANGFRGQLRQRQVVESNSRKGNVWDNAVKESFFSSVEMELL